METTVIFLCLWARKYITKAMNSSMMAEPMSALRIVKVCTDRRCNSLYFNSVIMCDFLVDDVSASLFTSPCDLRSASEPTISPRTPRVIDTICLCCTSRLSILLLSLMARASCMSVCTVSRLPKWCLRDGFLGSYNPRNKISHVWQIHALFDNAWG
jgi:hypothetical protein